MMLMVLLSEAPIAVAKRLIINKLERMYE